MLRRTHRRRSPVPTWVAVALVLAALAAASVALLARGPWVMRASVGVVTLVAVVHSLLLLWLHRRLRGADLQLSHLASALARAERHGEREIFRRERRIAELCLRVDTLQGRLDAATAAGMYVATVLASLDRGGRVTLGYTVSEPDAADDNDPDGEAQATAEEITARTIDEAAGDEPDARSVAALAIRPAEGRRVQIWPSVDDAPTVVDLLRWEDVRRAAGEQVLDAERSA